MSEVINVPKGWEVDIVENLVEIITGDKDTQDKLEDGKYPFYVRSNTVERINTYSFDGEAVLTAGDGVGVGKVFHHVNEKFDFHQRVYCIFNFSERLNSKYFFEYFRKNFIKRVNKYSAKGSVDSVRYEMISLMEIPVPPIIEQQQIAKILSTLDQAIESTQKLIAKEQNIKKGLMYDLLSNGIDENGKIRSPITHKYKESELGLIPEGWEVKTLANVLHLIKDGTHGTHKNVDNGIPLLSAKDINDGKIDLNNEPRLIDEEDYLQIHRNYSIEQNDILITIVGTIGRVAIVNIDTKFTLQRSVAILRVNEHITPQYAYYVFSSQIFLNQLMLKTNASAQGGVYLGTLSNSIIKLPKKISEQKQVANILTKQDNKIEIEEKNLDKLKKLKKGLMGDLLSGKVRVKV